MKKFLLLTAFVTVSAPAWAPPAFAQRADQLPAVMAEHGANTHIAAVVNDNVITTTDLEQRTKLAILASGLPDNPSVRARLLPQILRSLIDEKLQAQEAKKLDLSVSAEEIDKTMAHIAQDNHILGSMHDFLATHGVAPEAMNDQIKAGLLWNKVVQHELRPKVEVGDDEIDAVIERIRGDAGKEEFLVSEIFLPVDSDKDEEQVKQVADNIAAELRHGANFAAMARQFSQGAGAPQGGDIGWIQPGQLAPEINHALVRAGPGQVSDPIRTPNGFHIMGVREKRMVSMGDPTKASVNLMQAFLPYPANGDKNAGLPEAARLRTSFTGCANIDSLSSSFKNWKFQKLGNMTPAKAPDWMASHVQNVAAGSTSEPLATDKGTVVLLVCSRNDVTDVDRETLLHSIGTEKLELQARRLLSELRRSAYIDIRLGKEF